MVPRTLASHECVGAAERLGKVPPPMVGTSWSHGREMLLFLAGIPALVLVWGAGTSTPSGNHWRRVRRPCVWQRPSATLASDPEANVSPAGSRVHVQSQPARSRRGPSRSQSTVQLGHTAGRQAWQTRDSRGKPCVCRCLKTESTARSLANEHVGRWNRYFQAGDMCRGRVLVLETDPTCRGSTCMLGVRWIRFLLFACL